MAVDNRTLTPALLFHEALDLASHVRVTLEWDQGDRDSAIQMFTVAVDLVGRTHCAEPVLPRTRRVFRMPDLERQPGILTVKQLHMRHGFGFHVVTTESRVPELERA